MRPEKSFVMGGIWDFSPSMLFLIYEQSCVGRKLAKPMEPIKVGVPALYL